VYIDCPVESHDTWLLPHLAEQSKGTRYATHTCTPPNLWRSLANRWSLLSLSLLPGLVMLVPFREEYVAIPWALYKH
jgi:hypothetical protein